MTKIIISDEALVALEGLSVINNSMIINDKNLYVRLVDPTQKGIPDIVAEYKLKEGYISVDKEFGIYSIPELLKLVKSCDKSSLELEQDGNTLTIKDSRKNVTYYTQSVESLPIKNLEGDALYETGEIVISFALVQPEIEKIKSDLGLIKPDKLKLISEADGLYILAENTISSNKIKILVNKDYVELAKSDFDFPTVEIFNAIMDDSYKVEVRKCKHGNRDIYIMKLEGLEITGLSYILVSA